MRHKKKQITTSQHSKKVSPSSSTCSWLLMKSFPPLRSRWWLFPSYLPRCRATLRQMATAQRPQRAQCVLGRFRGGAPRRRAKGLKNMARWKCPKVKSWSSYCWWVYMQPLRYIDIFVVGSPWLTMSTTNTHLSRIINKWVLQFSSIWALRPFSTCFALKYPAKWQSDPASFFLDAFFLDIQILHLDMVLPPAFLVCILSCHTTHIIDEKEAAICNIHIFFHLFVDSIGINTILVQILSKYSQYPFHSYN